MHNNTTIWPYFYIYKWWHRPCEPIPRVQCLSVLLLKICSHRKRIPIKPIYLCLIFIFLYIVYPHECACKYNTADYLFKFHRRLLSYQRNFFFGKKILNSTTLVLCIFVIMTYIPSTKCNKKKMRRKNTQRFDEIKTSFW